MGRIPHLPAQHRRVKIALVTPAPARIYTGNQATATRWARLLSELGNQVDVRQDWHGEERDLLIALHARRSFPAIQRFHEKHPLAPLIVALTGTDLYRELETSAEAKSSLELASAIVVLQPLALEAVPERMQGKVRVIYQSAERPAPSAQREDDCFQVCVIAHLRSVKDPLRTAYAVRELPASSRIKVVHAGAVLDADFIAQVEAEQRTNPRYQWLGPLRHEEALELLAGSRVLVLTSRLEGGANVVSEAIASHIPVISSRIPGSLGILGKDYPGYFPAGDTAGLREQLQLAEFDDGYYRELKRWVSTLQPLLSPERERAAWRELLNELS